MHTPRRLLKRVVALALLAIVIGGMSVIAQTQYSSTIEGQLWKQLLPWGVNTGPAGETIWAVRQDLNNPPSTIKTDINPADGEPLGADPTYGDQIYSSVLPPNAASAYGWNPAAAGYPAARPWGWDEASAQVAAQMQFDMLGVGECTFSHAHDYDIAWWIFFPQIRYCKGLNGEKLPPAPGRLLNPVGIALSGTKVFVTDQFNHRVQVYDFYGRTIPTKYPIGNGVPGSGAYNYDTTYPLLNYRPYETMPGFETFDGGYSGHQLSAPQGIALDKNVVGTVSAPRVVIADSGNERLALFNEDGSPAFTEQVIEVVNDQPVLVTRPVHATIDTPVDGLGAPLGAPFKPYLLAVSQNAVISAPGTIIAAEDPQFGERIVALDWLHCYVAILDTGFNLIKSFPENNPAVSQHDSCSEPDIGPTGPGAFSTLSGAAIDAQGRIYISDFSMNVVQVFDRNGVFIAMIGKPGGSNPGGAGSLNGPVALLIDQFGRLGVMDAGNSRASFYDLSLGPDQARFAFQIPTTISVDDFGMSLALQVGPASEGLDPKGRILVTDPLRRRILRYELPELVIANAAADITLPDELPKQGVGSFDVVVPFQKMSPVNGVYVTVVPQAPGSVIVGTVTPALSTHPNIPHGFLVHYTFNFTSTIAEAKFDITARGDCDVDGLNCAAVAPDAEAVARALCTGCSANADIFEYPAPVDEQLTPAVAATLVDTTDQTIVLTPDQPAALQLVGGWYDRQVFVRISPVVPPGTPLDDPNRVISIEWSYGGQSGFNIGTFTTLAPTPGDGEFVDVPVTVSGLSWVRYRGITNEGSASAYEYVQLPVDLELPTLRFTSWTARSGTDGERDWHNQAQVVGAYEPLDGHSGPLTLNGTVTFDLEGRNQIAQIPLEDEVHNAVTRNSAEATLGRLIHIDRGAPVFVEVAPLEFTVPQTGSDLSGRFAVLVPGALLLHATDPLLSTGEPGSRSGPAFEVPSPAGTFHDGQTITFTATDFAGNSSTFNATIRIAQSTATVSYLSQDEVVYGSTLTMKAVVEPSFATGTVQFTFDGQTFTAALQDETVGVTTKRVATVVVPQVFSNVANSPYLVELTYSGDANLTAAQGTGAVRILKFPVRVTADNKWKYYGESDPPLTFVSVPDADHLLRPGDAFVGEIGRHAGNTVGTYTIETFHLSLNNPNYDLLFDNGLFTIVGLVTVNPRPVTITYGDPEPSFDFDFGAFPQGSSLANITVNPACSGVGPRTAGIHNIIQCSGAASDLGALLEFAYPKANLTIDKATPVVTLTGGPFLYDGASHPASCTVTGVGTDTLTGVINYAGGATPQNAGTYATTCSFAGNANYEPASASIDVVVDPRPLTVQGGTFNISLFGLVPDLTCSLTASVTSTSACSVVSGSLVGSDSVSGVLSWDLLMQIGAHPLEQGSVTVGPVASNYEFAYVNGVLNIANSAPNAVNDTATTASPFPVDIDVLANDSDLNGDTLTITSFTQSANGSVTQVGSQLRFTPTAGFSGVATFTYTISDGRGGSDTATVSVTVTPNGVPDARNDNASTTSPAPVDVAVLDNDVDADGDTLTISAFTQPATGSVTQVGSLLRYTPPAGFGGVVTFTYTISDGRGGSDTATVTITVNAPPDAVDDTATTRAGVAVVVAVLGNDTDADGDTLTISALTQPTSGGTVTQVGSTLSFVPAPGFSGTASFTYTISDGRGGTDTATVTINVTANTPPVALDDSTSTVSPNTVDINVLANDSDANGDTLTLTSVTQPTIGGSTTIVAGKVRFTPAPGFTGPATFTYTIDDGMGGSATATVLVTVSAPINNAPVALDDAAATSGAAPVDINVLANDSDIDGDVLTISAFTQPATGGTVTTSGSLLKFTPTPGFVGTATFTYTISDGKGGTDTATVTVTVSSGVCTLNGFTTYTQGGWGANPNGNNPAALLASRFSTVYPGGFVSIGGNRTLTFTSAPAIQAFLPAGGTASMLTSSATNPTSSSAGVFAGQVLALQLNVDFSRAGITKPGLGELLYMGYPVSTVLAAANQVLGGDTTILDEVDLNISELNAIVDAINNNFDNGTSNDGVLTCPSGTCSAGTLSLNGGSSSTSGTAGNIRTFNGNGVSVKVSGFSRVKTTGAWSTAFLGAYGSYGLGVTDGSEGSGSNNQHKVDNIGDRNNYMLFEFSSPVVVTKAWLDSIGADSDATIWLGNTADPYTNHLTLSDAVLTSLGTPQSNASTSTADRWATFNGANVAVNVVVIAGDVNDATPEDAFKIAKLDITCAPAQSNTAPTISLENRTNAKDASISLQLTGEDADEDDVLTYSASGLPTGLSMSTSGLVTGTAATAGTYTVTVTVTDASNATDSATFTWTITAANRAPDARNDSVTATKNTTRTITVLSNDTDPDGDDLTVTSFVVPASSVGTVTLLSDGRFSYKPKKNYTGSFSFSYTVSDGRGGSDSATVTVQVKSSHSSGDGCNHD